MVQKGITMSDAPITLFIPFGQGYGNPGLTIRADSTDELDSILAGLSDSSDASDPESSSKLDSLLDGVLTVRAGVLLKFPQEEKPARQSVTHPQATANPNAAPSCDHGEMKWRSGISRAGNEYKGYFCTAPQGATKGAACAPQFQK